MENFSFVVSAFPLENNCTVKLPAKSSNDGHDRDGGERRSGFHYTLSLKREGELSFSIPFVFAVKFPATSKAKTPYAYAFIAWVSN